MKKIPRTGVEVVIAGVGVLLAAGALEMGSGGFQVVRAGFAQAYDLSITKTDTPDPVIAGNLLTYTVVVTNTGAMTDSVTVTDPLPPETVFISAVASPGCTLTTPAVGTNGAVSCQFPSLASPTDMKSITIVVRVDAATPKDTIVSNTATVKPTQCTPPCDTDPTNDMSTATTLVDTSADLALVKTVAQDPVPAGNLLDYTLTVTNNGPSAAQDVMITDTIPPTTVFLTAQPSSGSCVTPPPNGTGMVKCTFPGATLQGQSHSVLITVRTCSGGGTCGGQLTNTGVGSSSTFDPDPSDNTDSVTSTVSPVPAPLLSGAGLLIEMVILLAVGAWALTRMRVVRS